MDRKTTDFLFKLNDAVSDGMKNRLVKKTDLYKDERDTVYRLLQNNRTPMSVKRKLEEILAQKTLYQEQIEIDPEVADELSKKVEYEVQKAIKSGQIPAPEMDDWMKKISKSFQK